MAQASHIDIIGIVTGEIPRRGVVILEAHLEELTLHGGLIDNHHVRLTGREGRSHIHGAHRGAVVLTIGGRRALRATYHNDRFFQQAEAVITQIDGANTYDRVVGQTEAAVGFSQVGQNRTTIISEVGVGCCGGCDLVEVGQRAVGIPAEVVLTIRYIDDGHAVS